MTPGRGIWRFPCVTAGKDEIVILQDAIEADPSQRLELDLTVKTVTCGDTVLNFDLPESNRISLLEGAWDSIGMLLEGADAVKAVAERLPYTTGFSKT